VLVTPRRIIGAAVVAFYAHVGIDGDSYSSGTYVVVDDLAPWWAWGLIGVAVGVAVLVSRHIAASAAAAALLACWGTAMAITSITGESQAPAAPLWPLAVAALIVWGAAHQPGEA
jgi:hypothetical protein